MHDLGDGSLDRFGFEDVADFDQAAGEGEGADVLQRLVQRVEEHQQELRHRGDRAGYVAQHHHPRLLDALLLPHGDERHAAPAHVAPERAPRRRAGRAAGGGGSWRSGRRGFSPLRAPGRASGPGRGVPGWTAARISAVPRGTFRFRRARTAAGCVRPSRAPDRAGLRCGSPGDPAAALAPSLRSASMSRSTWRRPMRSRMRRAYRFFCVKKRMFWMPDSRAASSIAVARPARSSSSSICDSELPPPPPVPSPPAPPWVGGVLVDLALCLASSCAKSSRLK